MSIVRLMKGHPYEQGKRRVTWPAIAETKLDEIRLDVRHEPTHKSNLGILFQSWADKPLHNLGAYASQFKELMRQLDVNRLDCGVMVNRNFNDTYRYVRSSKGAPPELSEAFVKFILFDVPSWSDVPFERRMLELDVAAETGRALGLGMLRPERCRVFSEQELFDVYSGVRSRGYEGVMLKSLDHTYMLGKRTYGWLKVKPESEEDGQITGVREAISESGEPLGRAGSIEFTMEDGSVAWAHGLKHDFATLIWEQPHSIIGQWGTFTYMERDRQGGYRHPRFARLREAKA